MKRGDTVCRDAFPVFLGGVALVTCPVVHGVAFVQLLHVLVPVSLRKYRGGSDCHVFAVTFDYAMMFDAPVRFETVAVHENVLGGDAQLSQCPVHSLDGRVEDVYFVYFLVVHGGDCPRESFPLDDYS